MPERKNDGILSLNVKKVLIVHLIWKTNRILQYGRILQHITVWEYYSIFHYAINFCPYLERQLT